MKVTAFRHDGLGNSSYLLDLGGGEAALVDPDRSVERYFAGAADWGLRIAAVLETHLHADFVSGSVEVAASTGATIHLPAAAEATFPHRPLRPGELLSLGDLQIGAIASPGHTPEHLSYVARRDGEPPVLFSGGSLLFGGAARTDLIDPSLTERLTRAQYRTLRSAFSRLPDDTVLMPTHGGGSFCSVGATRRDRSTLGEERGTNPILKMEDEDGFARWFPTTFPAAPAYFSRLRSVNKAGPRLKRAFHPPPALEAEEFDQLHDGALIVDTRPVESYAGEHIPGSLSNPFRSAYAVWLGWLAPAEIPLAFVVDPASLDRVVEESLLVGYERFAGWLRGGVEAWSGAGKPLARTALIDAATARKAMAEGAVAVDVRQPDERASGHVPGSVHLPLGEIAARASELPAGVPIVAYCGHGERASSAVSIMEGLGLGPLLNLEGGLGAWRDAGYPVDVPGR